MGGAGDVGVRTVELRADGGLPMVAGVPLSADVAGGRLWGLPPELVLALQEWARTTAGPAVGEGARGTGGPSGAHAWHDPASDGRVGEGRGDGGAGRDGDVPSGWGGAGLGGADGGGADGGDADPDAAGERVSRRGRHLAARLSGVLGAPVDYVDPVTGHRIPLRGVTRTPHPPPVALPPRGSVSGPVAEPTPWGTGLTLAAITAGLVLLANLALALPMISRLGIAGLVVDVVVALGLVPALWLNRRAPTWRWAVFGTLGALALTVPVLAVALVST